jgi:membrane fusion protein
MSLFRHEVINSRRSEWLGRVIVVRPVSFAVVALTAIACAGAILALLCFGKYTRHVQVTGLLVPDSGLTKNICTTARSRPGTAR